ncbi:MAG: thiamine-binding protein [Dehalococcoidia bacterium]|nr:thiamine-binding protein [Dehalococcoidia bacterium]
MLVEIECLPNPPGSGDNRYAHVEAAIAVIQQSGLRYEVDPLGTTIEGEPEALWPLVRRVHEACLEAGARSVVSVVKFAQSADEASGSTMESLTSKFRG